MSKHPVFKFRKTATRYGPYSGFHWFRSKPNGGPFLKSEKTTWWDINGFIIGYSYYRLTIVWKRRL